MKKLLATVVSALAMMFGAASVVVGDVAGSDEPTTSAAGSARPGWAPAPLTTLNNRATVQRRTARPQDAVAMFQRCLDLLGRTVPSDHPAVVTCLHNAASALRQAGRPARGGRSAGRPRRDARRRRGGGVSGVSGGTHDAPSTPGASSQLGNGA